MLADSIIKDSTLAAYGDYKIEWAKAHMPILNHLVKHYKGSQPFNQTVITASIHAEAKSACLIQALASLGAEVYAVGCNPLSTQDDVAAALARTEGVTVYAAYGIEDVEHRRLLCKALSSHPQLIVDNEGNLTYILHSTLTSLANRLLGGCEETATGIRRLQTLLDYDKLKYPMIDVDHAKCKYNYNNHFGTGQSVLDSIMHATNLIVAGKIIVIAGYGNCGSGIAKRASGMGAKVIITEVDSIKAVQAHLDGYTVMPMKQAAALGDIFITATGSKDVITAEFFQRMKSGAILANAGHSNIEIDIKALTDDSDCKYEVRPDIDCYMLSSGKHIYVLADGYSVNHVVADGQTVEIMDMNFSIQLLSLLYIKKDLGNIAGPSLYPVPRLIDQRVANLALQVNGLSIDILSKDQQDYLENNF